MHHSLSPTGKWASYGSEHANLVVSGHSHAASVLESVLALSNSKDTAGKERVLVCYTTDLASGPPGDDEYWNFVAEISKGKDLAIVWNGNQHNANFLFQTMPPFTVSGCPEVSLSGERFPITKSLMRAFFEPSFDELKEIVPKMSDSKSVSLVSGPAPKPLSHIKRRISQEVFFKNIADSLGVNVQDLAVTSDSVRVALWNILSEMLTVIARELDVGFISSPEDSIDANGLLHEIYWTPDVTHANSAYGELLVRKIYSVIDTGS